MKQPVAFLKEGRALFWDASGLHSELECSGDGEYCALFCGPVFGDGEGEGVVVLGERDVFSFD